MNNHHDVSCIIANSIYQNTKKLVNSETETWNIVYDNEAFIINFLKIINLQLNLFKENFI